MMVFTVDSWNGGRSPRPPAADARARAVEERIVPAPRGSPSARRGGEDHNARPVRLFERTPGRGGPFPPSEVARATPALSQALSDVTVRLCGVGTCRDPYLPGKWMWFVRMTYCKYVRWIQRWQRRFANGRINEGGPWTTTP